MLRKTLVTLLAVGFATGCALTDYPVITDADQTNSKKGEHVVNTSGQAVVAQESQVIKTLGDKDYEFVWYVDQDDDGNQTIYTRTATNPAGTIAFVGYTYLNNDRTGCWNYRADNPAEGDEDIFDNEANPDCEGTDLVAAFLSKGARTAEGGKDAAGHGNGGSVATSTSDGSLAGLSFSEQLDVAYTFMANEPGCDADCQDNTGFGAWAKDISVTPDNFGITFTADNGAEHTLAVDGVRTVVDVQNNRLWVDTRTGNLSSVVSGLADFVEANGRDGTISITYEQAGVTGSMEARVASAEDLRDLAERY